MNARRSGLLALSISLGFLVPAASAETLTFKHACSSGKRLTVAFAGDILFHRKLQVQAYAKGSSFKRFFKPVEDLLKSADLAYGNLEGPAARGVSAGGRAVKDPGKRMGAVYGAPLKSLSFNFHPSVVKDLKAVGFDLLSTANNHAMDRGQLGAYRTIDSFRKYKMPFTGTRKRSETPKRWSVVTKAKDMSVAWLACTFSTNGIPDPKKQVLHCYKKIDEILKEIKALKADPSIDAVFLTPHWGEENWHKPGARQKKLGRQAIEAGALAVFGAHPHVLQPWEKVTTNGGREGLIVYSAGNFISNQRRTAERAGILGLVQLIRTTAGKVRLAAAGYIPTWVAIDGKGHRIIVNSENGGREGEALSRTLGLLPEGNRMGGKTPFVFPTGCKGSKYAAFTRPRADTFWVRNPKSPKSGSSQPNRSWNRIFGSTKRGRKGKRRRRMGDTR